MLSEGLWGQPEHGTAEAGGGGSTGTVQQPWWRWQRMSGPAGPTTASVVGAFVCIQDVLLHYTAWSFSLM